MYLAWTFAGWQSYQIWIVVIGALACGAAALVGSFLVLRKMSLMGDAISHAVLPGIVIAVLLTGELSSWPVLLGAGAIGLLTPYLIDLLQSTGKIYEDAAIGAVYTFLFAIGVILVVQKGGNVDLDVDCVLFGEIATAPFDIWILGGVDLGPRSFWTLGGVFALNLLFVAFFYKELKIYTFDPAMAYALGLRPRLMHYLLLALVALTTIAAFEAVGSILVVAMLIAPGAAAYLLTDRLSRMLLLAMLLGVAAAFLGYLLALSLGGRGSIAGSMAAVAGLLFALAFLFSPRYGVIVRWYRQRKLALRLAGDHILLDLFRAHEESKTWLSLQQLQQERQDDRSYLHAAAHKLQDQGLLFLEEDRLRLTSTGSQKAEELLRAHRLWEAYLEDRLQLPSDHLHRSADDTEHFLSPQLQEELARSLDYPQQSPSGKPIPGLPSALTPTPPTQDPSGS